MRRIFVESNITIHIFSFSFSPSSIFFFFNKDTIFILKFTSSFFQICYFNIENYIYIFSPKITSSFLMKKERIFFMEQCQVFRWQVHIWSSGPLIETNAKIQRALQFLIHVWWKQEKDTRKLTSSFERYIYHMAT